MKCFHQPVRLASITAAISARRTYSANASLCSWTCPCSSWRSELESSRRIAGRYLNYCSVSLKFVGDGAVETATLAELRRPDTIALNSAFSQNVLDEAATTRKMK